MDQNFSDNYFTIPINEEYPPQKIQSNNQFRSDNGAELYDFLFGDGDFQPKINNLEQQELQQRQQRQQKNSIHSDTRSTKKQIDKAEYSLKQTTGRLDFRSSSNYVSDSQLKSMSSKERRQLRNKISARNFRNRRKEYISTLEEEMNEHKAENQRLKAELKVALDTIDKLRKENDNLRLNVILGETVLPSEDQTAMENLPNSILPTTTSTSTTFNNTTTISVCSSNNFSSNSSSNDSILSSPPNLWLEPSNDWNFVLPNFSNTTVNNQPSTYLSHALLPMWNFNQILSKEQTSAKVFPGGTNQLFYQYPLLAPALMSVVLNHTMTMSTEELLSNSHLYPDTTADYIKYNEKNPFETSSTITDKEAKAVWDILEPLTLLNERSERIINTNRESDVATQPQFTQNDDDFYLPWFQRYMYKYLFDYITTGTLENPSRQRKFILCVKFQQARRYIAA
ncbi:hypothetical protein K501DRAFT_330201 [Backusella circina FSU 941]|nr:hypothetical protein K501DRAFT_330201 [Backusella circina FSU 941]